MAPISVLVVDDHPIVLDGVRHLVDSTPWITLAGFARTGREAIVLAEQTRPDVVLLDLRLPDMLGPEAVTASTGARREGRGLHAYPDHAAVEPLSPPAPARRAQGRRPGTSST